MLLSSKELKSTFTTVKIVKSINYLVKAVGPKTVSLMPWYDKDIDLIDPQNIELNSYTIAFRKLSS